MSLVPRSVALLLPAALLLALSAALLLAQAGRPALADMAGMPKIIDGDTIELNGEAIRLYGIDAPELGQICRIKARSYDCGEIARTALLDLTAGVAVTCRIVPPGPGGAAGDGRPGRCTAEGYDLSEGMAYTGWALAHRQVSERYVVFEDQARAAGRGLWRGRFITPWDWRGGARLPGEQESPSERTPAQ
jgi:endonuclease YncB( thermonuclease family)